MSNPVLFFIFIVVVDLILKSVKNKKKMEKNRAEKDRMPQNELDINKQKPIQRSAPIRDIMTTLREEVERERLKELERRQGKVEQIQVEKNQEVEDIRKVNVMAKKAFEDEDYWNKKRKVEQDEKLAKKVEFEKRNKNINIREDIVKGFIFSEILAEPKSIKNQRKSM